METEADDGWSTYCLALVYEDTYSVFQSRSCQQSPLILFSLGRHSRIRGMEILREFPWPEPQIAHEQFVADASTGRLKLALDADKVYELMLRETGGPYRCGLRFWGTIGLFLRSRTIHESNRRTAVEAFYKRVAEDATFYRIACGYGAIRFPELDSNA